MVATCNLCRKFGAAAAPAEPYDRILFESANFVAVPTAGSIVPGWLLIVPRKHFLCIGAFGEALLRELMVFRHAVSAALRETFGPVVFFEHGPAEPATSIGCGVDHAHLHLVAVDADLREGANKISSTPLKWTPTQGLRALRLFHVEGLPYLYFEDQRGEGWICSPPKIESQLFRRVIATTVGEAEKFDWKQNPFSLGAEETIRRVEKWKREHRPQSLRACA